jgi:hypothetical protein
MALKASYSDSIAIHCQVLIIILLLVYLTNILRLYLARPPLINLIYMLVLVNEYQK